MTAPNNRAERRRLRRMASDFADLYIRRGIFDVVGDRLVRVTHPASLRAMRRAIEECLRQGGAPIITPLRTEAALGFPDAINRPSGIEDTAATCWLMVGIDREGRAAFKSQWATSNAPTAEMEAALVSREMRADFLAWCGTPGFGDGVKAEGSL